MARRNKKVETQVAPAVTDEVSQGIVDEVAPAVTDEVAPAVTEDTVEQVEKRANNPKGLVNINKFIVDLPKERSVAWYRRRALEAGYNEALVIRSIV